MALFKALRVVLEVVARPVVILVVEKVGVVIKENIQNLIFRELIFRQEIHQLDYLVIFPVEMKRHPGCGLTLMVMVSVIYFKDQVIVYQYI